MIRTQIYLTRQERDLLRQLAQETGKSQSKIIREALDTFFENEELAELLTKIAEKGK